MTEKIDLVEEIAKLYAYQWGRGYTGDWHQVRDELKETFRERARKLIAGSDYVKLAEGDGVICKEAWDLLSPSIQVRNLLCRGVKP